MDFELNILIQDLIKFNVQKFDDDIANNEGGDVETYSGDKKKHLFIKECEYLGILVILLSFIIKLSELREKIFLIGNESFLGDFFQPNEVFCVAKKF